MARKNRIFTCTHVNEDVQIYLRKRQRGINGAEELFVQCNQQDCQYVDTNATPCPLHLDMFSDEIREREEQARRRREENDY